MVAGRAHERKPGGDLAAEDSLGQRDDAARRPPCRTSRLRIVEHVAAERPAATRAAAPRASERRLGVGERLEGVEVLRCVNRLRLRPRRLAWSHPRQPVQQPSLAKRTVDDAHALGRLDVGPGARWRKVLRMAVVDEADGHEMPEGSDSERLWETQILQAARRFMGGCHVGNTPEHGEETCGSKNAEYRYLFPISSTTVLCIAIWSCEVFVSCERERDFDDLLRFLLINKKSRLSQ